MKNKFWTICGYLMTLFLLNGCKSSIEYNPELFKPDQANCWPCKMYLQAFNAIQSTLNAALPVLAENTISILKVALPLWLMFKILPWFISLKEPNMKKDLTEIIIVFFKTVLVVMLLSIKTGSLDSRTVYIDFDTPGAASSAKGFSGYTLKGIEGGESSGKIMLYDVAGKMFIQPVADIFLGISELALATPSSVGVSLSNYSSGGLSGSTFGDFFSDLLKTLNKATGGAIGDWDISKISSQFESLVTNDKIATDAMFGELPMKIQSIVWLLYDALWSGMGLAFQLFLIKSIPAFFAGLLIFWALFEMMIKLPISFVESILYLGITVILLPFYLAYWIFPKLSKGILKNLFHQIFAAFFDILFYCIYVAFLISVLRSYLQANTSVSYLFNSDFQSQESGLREAASNMSTPFLIMTILIWAILKLFDHVHEYSKFFFDGAGERSGIGNLINRFKKMAYQAGKAAVMAVAGNYAGAGKALAGAGKELQGIGKDAIGEANK